MVHEGDVVAIWGAGPGETHIMVRLGFDAAVQMHYTQESLYGCWISVALFCAASCPRRRVYL
jgi:hypothetical protein